MRLCSSALFLALGAIPTIVRAGGPCEPQWLPSAGTSNAVLAFAGWDPDGPGPKEAVLVAGGFFTQAGGRAANRIAQWDGEKWSPLGTGLNNNVRALAVAPDGTLVVAGDFSTAGGITAHRVARWDGTTWSVVGEGLGLLSTNSARAVTVMPDGTVVVGGVFSLPDRLTAHYILRWNGSAWVSVGGGAEGGNVFALRIMPDGQLVAGGTFRHMGGVLCNGIARWDGASWHAFGGGLPGGVTALTVGHDGALVAGGFFFSGSVFQAPADFVARWNGTAWASMGTGMDMNVHSLTTQLNGDIIAGGEFFTAGGVPARGIARWDGSSWSGLGTGIGGYVLALAPLSGHGVAAGGVFHEAGGQDSPFFAQWGVPEGCCAADFDGDGFITGADYDLYVHAFEAGDVSSDFDGDGFVTGADFDQYVLAFEAGC